MKVIKESANTLNTSDTQLIPVSAEEAQKYFDTEYDAEISHYQPVKQWYFQKLDYNQDGNPRVIAIVAEFEDGTWYYEEPDEVILPFNSKEEVEAYLRGEINPEDELDESKKVKKEKTEKKIKEGYNASIEYDSLDDYGSVCRSGRALNYNTLDGNIIDVETGEVVTDVTPEEYEDLAKYDGGYKRAMREKTMKEGFGGDTGIDADFGGSLDERIEQAHDTLQDFDEQSLIRILDRYDIDDNEPSILGAIDRLSDEDKEFLLDDLESAIDALTEGKQVKKEKTEKKLTESMKMFIDPQFEYGGMAVFELPKGFVYFDSSDPGAISCDLFYKEGIFANATAETFYSIYQDDMDNNDGGAGIAEASLDVFMDFNPRYEYASSMQVLLGAKEAFKEIGATKADVMKIAQFAEGALGEDEEDW